MLDAIGNMRYDIVEALPQMRNEFSLLAEGPGQHSLFVARSVSH